MRMHHNLNLRMCPRPTDPTEALARDIRAVWKTPKFVLAVEAFERDKRAGVLGPERLNPYGLYREEKNVAKARKYRARRLTMGPESANKRVKDSLAGSVISGGATAPTEVDAEARFDAVSQGLAASYKERKLLKGEEAQEARRVEKRREIEGNRREVRELERLPGTWICGLCGKRNASVATECSGWVQSKRSEKKVGAPIKRRCEGTKEKNFGGYAVRPLPEKPKKEVKGNPRRGTLQGKHSSKKESLKAKVHDESLPEEKRAEAKESLRKDRKRKEEKYKKSLEASALADPY